MKTGYTGQWIAAGLVLVGVVVVSLTPERHTDEHHKATYDSYSAMYAQVSNDRYSALFEDASYRAQGDMLAAADKACNGFLNEDFSCSEDKVEGESSAISMLGSDAAPKASEAKDSGNVEDLRRVSSHKTNHKVATQVRQHLAKTMPADDSSALPEANPYLSGDSTFKVYDATAYDYALDEAIEDYAAGNTAFTPYPVEIRKVSSASAADVVISDESGLMVRGKKACGAYGPSEAFGIKINSDLVGGPHCIGGGDSGARVMEHELAHALGLHPHEAKPREAREGGE